MISLKDLFAKIQTLSKEMRDVITKAKLSLKRFYRVWKPYVSETRKRITKIYKFMGMVASIIGKYTSIIVRHVVKFTLFMIGRSCALFRYVHRRIYVWKIMSVRYRWYLGKKGNLYNPKLKASIFPTWTCTWNLTRQDDEYQGLESKEYAQKMAFKLWMKKRLFQRRLQHYDPKTRNAVKFSDKINLSPKILPNKVLLRMANPNDSLDLVVLMGQAGYPKNDQGMKTRILSYLEKRNHHIIVATKRNTIVGFIAFMIHDLFLMDGKGCRIEGMIVDANQQDLSVKRKLMQAAEIYARDNESTIIDLIDNTCRTKDGSYDFYKFLGYNNETSTSKVYLRKEL